ncbi:MAG: 50S ribosomal protein L25 [Lentisphaeria bacterium]
MSKQDVTLKAEARDERGNGPARRLRRAGRIPAVIYGHGQSGRALSLEEAAFKAVIHHPGLISIDAGTETVTAIIKDVQRDIFSGRVSHVDLQAVGADEIITVTVQLEAVGDPAGMTMGGQLEQNMRHLDVKVRAADLFETLKVDVSGMALDTVMHIRDLKLPEGVVALGDPDMGVFQVRLPKMEEEKPAEGEAAAAGTEPEVIAKGKKEEEGEAGAAAPGGAAKPEKKK